MFVKEKRLTLFDRNYSLRYFIFRFLEQIIRDGLNKKKHSKYQF